MLVYSRSLVGTGAIIADWRKFIQDLFCRVKGSVEMVPARDSKSTRCCVYTTVDFANANVKWDYLDGDVIAVGNQDLGRFGLDEEQLGTALRSTVAPERRKSMWIPESIPMV